MISTIGHFENGKTSRDNKKTSVSKSSGEREEGRIDEAQWGDNICYSVLYSDGIMTSGTFQKPWNYLRANSRATLVNRNMTTPTHHSEQTYCTNPRC